MGFAQKWMEWMMTCVSLVKYNISVNGELVGPITLNRGGGGGGGGGGAGGGGGGGGGAGGGGH